MLEFYPMPTNLSHGTGLYPHHQNHGGARFLDNPASSAAGPPTNASGLNNNSNCGQHHQQHQLLHQQHQLLHQQQQHMTTSPTHAACAPNNSSHNNNHNNHSNNNNNTNSGNSNSNSPTATSISASSTASLTAQAISALATAAAAAATAAAAQVNSNAASSSSASCAATATAACATPTTATLSSSCASSASSAPQSQSLSLSPATASAAASASALALASSKLSADCSGRTEVGHIKCEKNYEICEGCGQKIHDRYLMNVGDSNWHEQCLSCCYCGLQLHHTCYVRNAKLYCKLDYDRLFGIKCAACCHPVLPQEMVMRPIPNFIFHLPCFVCYACRLPLQKGEQFVLRDGQLFCYRHDLEKELYLAAAQHCGFVGLDEEDLMRPRDGRRGPKRPRTILTSQQRKQFKASFDQSPKPCRKVREALAKDTGLSVRVVQVWFQNQRAKMKKIQRKAKNGGTGGSSRNADDKDAKDKDEKSVKQECGTSSGDGSYLGLSDSAFASQPLNPNLPFSPDDYPANSNDSFCSSDLSLDGSNFDQLDDDTDSLSLNNLELQSTGSSGNHQHSNPHDIIANLNTSLINPIDKLYLMQNSYFNGEQ